MTVAGSEAINLDGNVAIVLLRRSISPLQQKSFIIQNIRHVGRRLTAIPAILAVGERFKTKLTRDKGSSFD